MSAAKRVFEVSAQRQKLFEGSADRALGVIFLERLPPIFTEVPQLSAGFRGRETRAATIHRLYAFGFKGIDCLPHSAQIGMQYSNESAANQKIEAAKSDEGSWIVK
jgi:hypothetical protein